MTAKPSVVFGAHLLRLPAGSSLPPAAVVFNLEQHDPAQPSPWFSNPSYVSILRSQAVWDFSPSNTEALRHHRGLPRVHWVPLGIAEGDPVISRKPPAERDIDVCFFGSLCPRRVAVLEALARRGLTVKVLQGVYGPQRDAWLARARLEINIHFYEAGRFEWPRVLPLVASGIPVVSEMPAAGDVETGLNEAVCLASYQALVDACVGLLRDPTALDDLAARGRAYAQRRLAASYVADAIHGLPMPFAKP